MSPPSACPVRTRASCVVIVAWRVPQPPCERVLGGRARAPPRSACPRIKPICLYLPPPGKAGLGGGGAGRGEGGLTTGFRVPDCSAFWGLAPSAQVQD